LSFGSPGYCRPVNSPHLRPLGIGEILDVGIKIYFRHVGTFLRIIVFVVLPAQAVQAVVLVSAGVQQTSFSFNTSSNVTSANSGTYVAGYTIVLLISLLSTAIATGACFKAVADAYLEGAPDWKSSLKYAARRLHSILWISILGGILTGLGLIAVLVGAVYLWVGFTVAVPVLLTEGVKGSKALRRSLDLIRGRWWPTFGLVLIGLLLASVIGGIVSGLAQAFALTSGGDQSVAEIVVLTVSGTIAAMVTLPFKAAYSTVLYFDLRVRKEAFDLQLLAKQLGIDVREGVTGLLPPPPGPPLEGEQPPYWPPPPGWKPSGVAPPAAPAVAETPAPADAPPYWPPPPGWKPGGTHE
jgi:hypothetical protein